jgi:hypothetical protein
VDSVHVDYREKVIAKGENRFYRVGGLSRARSQGVECFFPVVTLLCGKNATVSASACYIVVMVESVYLSAMHCLPGQDDGRIYR